MMTSTKLFETWINVLTLMKSYGADGCILQPRASPGDVRRIPHRYGRDEFHQGTGGKTIFQRHEASLEGIDGDGLPYRNRSR